LSDVGRASRRYRGGLLSSFTIYLHILEGA
jgi:hypothetical protein